MLAIPALRWRRQGLLSSKPTWVTYQGPVSKNEDVEFGGVPSFFDFKTSSLDTL